MRALLGVDQAPESFNWTTANVRDFENYLKACYTGFENDEDVHKIARDIGEAQKSTAGGFNILQFQAVVVGTLTNYGYRKA